MNHRSITEITLLQAVCGGDGNNRLAVSVVFSVKAGGLPDVAYWVSYRCFESGANSSEQFGSFPAALAHAKRVADQYGFVLSMGLSDAQ